MKMKTKPCKPALAAGVTRVIGLYVVVLVGAGVVPGGVVALEGKVVAVIVGATVVVMGGLIPVLGKLETMSVRPALKPAYTTSNKR